MSESDAGVRRIYIKKKKNEPKKKKREAKGSERSQNPAAVKGLSQGRLDMTTQGLKGPMESQCNTFHADKHSTGACLCRRKV